jgi:hypothetical protein
MDEGVRPVRGHSSERVWEEAAARKMCVAFCWISGRKKRKNIRGESAACSGEAVRS